MTQSLDNNLRPIDTSCAIVRTNNDKLDSYLGHAFPVLDHGFIRVVDYMGSDAGIADSARVSYGEGTRHISEDEGLIRYLMRHLHTSPFEMASIKLHIRMPIFVARQWIRHRTAKVNEYSGRYSIMRKEFYLPEPDQIKQQSRTNNQGREGGYDDYDASSIRDIIDTVSREAFGDYEILTNRGSFKDEAGFELEGYGLARELSRMVLPVNYYTELYWKIDAHNLMHFLRLRTDPHAQYEIRVYADLIASILADWLPLSSKAFQDYVISARTFSKNQMVLLSNILNSTPMRGEDLGMSQREIREFETLFAELQSARN